MPDKAKKNRLPLKQAIINTKRGFQIWRETEPRMIPALVLVNAAEALSPYVPLFFTARLVDELAGDRDPARLWQWLAALLLGTAAMGVFRALAKRWNEMISNEALYNGYHDVQIKKLLSMDYCDVEKPETQALLSEIQMTSQWNAWG